MIKRVRKKPIALGTILSFLIVLSPVLLTGQISAKGNIIGFVYEKDRTSPLEGVVVKFKSLTKSLIYESTKSDKTGLFKVEGVESGVYIYGIIAAEGDFNSDNFVGVNIKEGETAKLSISVNRYEPQVSKAISQVYLEQQKAGEAWVGTVLDFNASSRLAQVEIQRGLLQVNDRIRAKGQQTDFYQDVKVLKNEMAAPVRRVFAGQKALLALNQNAKPGDLVYIVCKKGILPLFLTPLGVASVIAGSSAIIYGIVDFTDDHEPVSPFKR